MARRRTSRAELFLDASYAIALSAPADQHHQRAVELAEQVEATDARLVTTRAVVLEIGYALAKQRYRPAAIRLLTALEADPNIEIVALTDPPSKKALALYCQRRDKESGLTDCVSFALMEERRMTAALTAADDFRQAGFRALLLES